MRAKSAYIRLIGDERDTHGGFTLCLFSPHARRVPGPPMNVLIVDDEPLVAETLRLIFLQSGYRVQAVHNAGEARRAAASTSPDLVICDIEMPGEDGVELMRHLGRELPHCPVLVLTGDYSHDRRIRQTASCMPAQVQILNKPCAPAHLLHTAVAMLARS